VRFEAAASVPARDDLVVGADYEDSAATGVNGSQSDNSAEYSGAIYVFTYSAP
jgi:trimeric autotransporter adhesin